MTAMEDQSRYFLLIHIPDSDRCCVWCSRKYREPISYPCPRRKLADRILAGSGVAS